MRRCLALNLDVQLRFTCLNDAPHSELDRVGQVGHQVADPLTDTIGRGNAVDLSQAVVDANPAKLPVQRAQADRSTAVEAFDFQHALP